MDVKPILFNTGMVRALLENRKTVTRRLVKPQPVHENGFWKFGGATWSDNLSKITPVPCHTLYNRAPYRPGSILYVRETFTTCCMNETHRKGHSDFCYKASCNSPVYGCIDLTAPQVCKWHPSIHMPIEAARIFLQVTDVWVERLQEITEKDAIAEGFEAIKCDHPGGYPCTDCMNTGYLEPAMLGFIETWNRTIKPADRTLYGWDANPWVWVIAFQRISREEVTN